MKGGKIKRYSAKLETTSQKIENDYKAAAVKNAGAGAAGGGGMAAGNTFLALAGSVGWAIAGVALIASGLMFWKLK